MLHHSLLDCANAVGLACGGQLPRSQCLLQMARREGADTWPEATDRG
jgi:hypothetical protein